MRKFIADAWGNLGALWGNYFEARTVSPRTSGAADRVRREGDQGDLKSGDVHFFGFPACVEVQSDCRAVPWHGFEAHAGLPCDDALLPLRTARVLRDRQEGQGEITSAERRLLTDPELKRFSRLHLDWLVAAKSG